MILGRAALGDMSSISCVRILLICTFYTILWGCISSAATDSSGCVSHTDATPHSTQLHTIVPVSPSQWYGEGNTIVQYCARSTALTASTGMCCQLHLSKLSCTQQGSGLVMLEQPLLARKVVHARPCCIDKCWVTCNSAAAHRCKSTTLAHAAVSHTNFPASCYGPHRDPT